MDLARLDDLIEWLAQWEHPRTHEAAGALTEYRDYLLGETKAPRIGRARVMRPYRVKDTPANRRRFGPPLTSYTVIYRRGGRGSREQRFSTFPSRREAEQACEMVNGWLRLGLDPRLEWERRYETAAAPKSTLSGEFDRWAASRHDVGPKAQHNYRIARQHLVEFFGPDREPRTITVADCRSYIAHLANELAPGTVRSYYNPLQQLLDYLEIQPNPARSPTIKKPKQVTREIVVPSGTQARAVLGKLPDKYQLPFRLAECTGMRINVEILALEWGDLDFAEGRIRVSEERTKGRSGGKRWVPIPSELLAQIDQLLPLEDRRPERKLFPAITGKAARANLDLACKLAGTPHIRPHDLRHRRISLWVANQLDPVQVKAWAGHTKAEMSLNRYGHVMVDASDDEWREFWLGAYLKARGLPMLDGALLERLMRRAATVAAGPQGRTQGESDA